MPYRFALSFWFQFGFMCLIVGAVTVLAIVIWNIEAKSKRADGGEDVVKSDVLELSDEPQACGIPSKQKLADSLIRLLVGNASNVGEAAPATIGAKISLFLLDALFLTLIGNLLSGKRPGSSSPLSPLTLFFVAVLVCTPDPIRSMPVLAPRSLTSQLIYDFFIFCCVVAVQRKRSCSVLTTASLASRECTCSIHCSVSTW